MDTSRQSSSSWDFGKFSSFGPDPQFMTGLGVLAGVAKLVVIFFYRSDLSELPRVYALISYFFVSGLAVFSIIVFRPFLNRNFLALLFTSQLVALYAPYDDLMTGSLIGTRYLCLYFAFLVVIYFEKVARTNWEWWGSALVLALCVNTYQSVYVLLPVTWFYRWRSARRDNRRDPRLWPTLVTGLLSLPQAVLILKRGPRVAGYLDGPYDWSQTVRLFFFEGGLRPLIAGTGIQLNDYWVIGYVLVAVATLFFLADRKTREILLIGLSTLFFGTIFILVARPHVGQPSPYLAHVPFFDSHTLIVGALFILFTNDVVARLPKAQVATYAFVVLWLFQMTEYHRKHAASAARRSPIPFPEQVRYLCAGRQEDRTYVYPNPVQRASFWVFRQILCPESQGLPLQAQAKRLRH